MTASWHIKHFKKCFSMQCCHLLWDGGIFIVAYNNRVSLSRLHVLLCKTWMVSVPCPDSYFRPKSRSWSRAWPAFVPDTSGCKLPLSWMAQGFSSSSKRYGRREETDVPRLVHMSDTQHRGAETALLDLKQPWLDLVRSVWTDGCQRDSSLWLALS